eukprot:5764080-Amphidinium_carterae.1
MANMRTLKRKGSNLALAELSSSVECELSNFSDSMSESENTLLRVPLQRLHDAYVRFAARVPPLAARCKAVWPTRFVTSTIAQCAGARVRIA